MHGHLGEKIKYFRLKSNMTQSKLARGIISIPYLSKIENGKIDPPEEIVELLMERLQISHRTTENYEIHQLCESWFKSLFYANIEESIKTYEVIMEDIDKIVNTNLINLVEIHKLRYFLITNNKKLATCQYEYLHKEKMKFRNKEKYYWYKFSASYHYFRLSFSESLTLFQEAEKFLGIDISEEEKYDLYYMIALTASKLRQTRLSFTYITKALDYYQNVYNLKRCSECHILMGIAYQRTNELEKSLESFKLAASIINEQDNQNILAICNQNIGKHYSMINQSEKAIHYYLSSYNLREDSPIDKKLIPVSSLMKEYYKIGDLTNAEQWLNIGIDLSSKLIPNESLYVYEFKVYSHLIKGIGEIPLEELIIKKVLPFLEKRDFHYEKFTYLRILAGYYYAKKRYKLAANFYESASNTVADIYKE